MLYKRRLLICRPKAQGDKLTLSLQALGVQPILFPTMVIEPIEPIEPIKATQAFMPMHLSLQSIEQANMILVQSPNSIVYLDQTSLMALSKSQVIYAMGAGTQEALLSKNIISHWVGARGFSSESILNHAPVTHLSLGSKILLLTGEGGRAILEPALIQKGFSCERVNTYQRTIPVYTKAERAAILAELPDAILITSVESLKNLLHIFKEDKDKDKDKLLCLPLLVISQRIQAEAIALGWQGKISVALSASVEDISAIFLSFRF